MRILLVGIFLILAFATPRAFAEKDKGAPNLLFILADDLGWSDLSCYGNAVVETPHLDRLAEQGMRFTEAYAPAPICSASRAAFLTGKTPARLGFEFVTKNEAGRQTLGTPLLTPPFTLNLPLKEVTIAETLSTAGYRTAFFGKWHLNRHHQRYLGWSPTHGPLAQGFQVAIEDFGCHPYSYWRDQKERKTFLDLPPGQYPPDSMTRRAVEFLREKHETPFFLMVSHFFVHDPIHTKAEELHDHYLARIPSDHPRRAILAHYYAMVATLDHLVGDLLEALDKNGLTDSTLVVFTSDNGGHPNYAGNAPLRGSKWNLYEGGIRVPFIARWPGHIAPGSLCDEPISGIDLLPTFSEIAGASPPPSIDGQSLKRLFEETESELNQRDLLWHFPYYHPEKNFAESPAAIGIDDGATSQTRPHSAIRSGPWKLIHFYENDRQELYHLPSDPSESEDRSRSEEGTRKKLLDQLRSSLESMEARLPEARP